MPKLTESEQAAVDRYTETIMSGRDERAEKIAVCMEALEATDELSRHVAKICIETFLAAPEDHEPAEYMSHHRRSIHFYAPGVYMASAPVRQPLIRTGGFLTIGDFKDSAEALKINPDRAFDAMDFLYQWAAIKHPDSKSAAIVETYGLSSGKMRCDFHTPGILYSYEHAQSYLDAIQDDFDDPVPTVDPIIALAATDNWDYALSLTSERKRRQLS